MFVGTLWNNYQLLTVLGRFPPPGIMQEQYFSSSIIMDGSEFPVCYRWPTTTLLPRHTTTTTTDCYTMIRKIFWEEGKTVFYSSFSFWYCFFFFQINREQCFQSFLYQNRVFTEISQLEFEGWGNDKVSAFTIIPIPIICWYSTTKTVKGCFPYTFTIDYIHSCFTIYILR